MDNSINTNIQSINLNKSQDNNEDNIQQVSKDFEQLFLQELLRTALKDVNIAGSSAGSDIVKDMYLENIAKVTAGNMGISQLLIEHLANNKTKKD